MRKRPSIQYIVCVAVVLLFASACFVTLAGYVKVKQVRADAESPHPILSFYTGSIQRYRPSELVYIFDVEAEHVTVAIGSGITLKGGAVQLVVQLDPGDLIQLDGYTYKLTRIDKQVAYFTYQEEA